MLADHDYVVAQEAELEGTIRVFTPEIRKQTKARLEALAKSIAEVYGGTAEVEWKDFTSPLINDPAATAEAQKITASLLGEEKLIRQRRPELGGDDFAEYILRAPGAYAYVGSGNPEKPNTRPAHHNSCFDIDKDCLKVSVALSSCYAIEYLNGEV
ncbi:MAG: hypothetical protein MSA25_05665 [Clostridiales bacterium]|nr:hypothetical protein [Clostridiales bacterium]